MRHADEIRDDLFCPYCNKQCKNLNSLGVHKAYCHMNPDRKIAKGNHQKGRIPWNKGKTKFDDERINNAALKIKTLYNSQEFKERHLSMGRRHDEKLELERRDKISRTMKNNKNAGGYRKGSGRGKKGWYKNIFCDSSWELALVIYYTDHNMNIKRCTDKRKYIFNDHEYTYIPDFITDDGIIEIKGYITEQWMAKLQYNPDIIVLYKEDIKKYIDYAVNNYGKDYISLYEDK